MTDQSATWQLPDGVDELLPDDAWRVDQLRRQFTDSCHSCGFELVMPPLIEYIDALLTGTGEATSLQTFKVIDQQSGRTLGVRADMTPQVARLDAHVLRQNAPTRLCYTGTVLRARTDGFGGSRTPQQFGAELFGSAGVAADIEMIRLMLGTARLAGLKDEQLILDLGHVGVFQGLCAVAGLNDLQQEQVFKAMQLASLPDMQQALEAANCAPELNRAFVSLLELCGGVDTLNLARTRLLTQELRGLISPSSDNFIESALQTLENVVAAVQLTHPNIRLVIDLTEIRGYHYHTGVLFAVLNDAGAVLARGGRYDAIGKAFGRDRPATGFSGDLTQLAQLARAAAAAAAAAAAKIRAGAGSGSGSGASNGSSAGDEANGIFVPHNANLTADDEAALWLKHCG